MLQFKSVNTPSWHPVMGMSCCSDDEVRYVVSSRFVTIAATTITSLDLRNNCNFIPFFIIIKYSFINNFFILCLKERHTFDTIFCLVGKSRRPALPLSYLFDVVINKLSNTCDVQLIRDNGSRPATPTSRTPTCRASVASASSSPDPLMTDRPSRTITARRDRS